MRFLLDTNVLSEAGKKRPHPKVLNWLLAHEPASGVPSVALAERYHGAHSASREQRVRLLAELGALVAEALQKIVPFDAEAARVWGEYISRPALKQNPRGYRHADCRHRSEPWIDHRHPQHAGFSRSAGAQSV